MKQKKEIQIDRRIQKTKKALTEALIQLILDKGYEKVTIQDIIDKANVGRSTFYIHYENKEQLLQDGHNNLNVKIFENSDNTKEIDFLNLFNHVSENKNLAKAMLGKKGGFAMNEFFKHNIALKVKERFGKQFGKSRDELRMLNYLSDASGAIIISLLLSWLEDDMPLTVPEIARKGQEVVYAIFKDV